MGWFISSWKTLSFCHFFFTRAERKLAFLSRLWKRSADKTLLSVGISLFNVKPSESLKMVRMWMKEDSISFTQTGKTCMKHLALIKDFFLKVLSHSKVQEWLRDRIGLLLKKFKYTFRPGLLSFLNLLRFKKTNSILVFNLFWAISWVNKTVKMCPLDKTELRKNLLSKSINEYFFTHLLNSSFSTLVDCIYLVDVVTLWFQRPHVY